MALRKRRTERKETPQKEVEQTAGAETTGDESPPFTADEEQLKQDEADAKAALEGKKSRTQVVPKTESSDITTAQKKPQNSVMAELEEDGLEGLELGFGSFPILKLENEGVFADTEDNEYGKSFECSIIQTKPKYVLKNTKCEKKDEEAFYTYDRVTATDGTPIEDIIAEWAEDGWGFEMKHYLEAPTMLIGGEMDGEMVLLSIPPASKNRLSGYFYTNRLKGRGPSSGYITECYVGKKVDNEKGDFYPWKFKYKGPAED